MEIRDATADDADFLAWVQLTAARSHVERGILEYINDQDEDRCLDFIRRMTTSDVVSFFHWSLFQIAEVDGTPAAAMCGYDADTQGTSAIGELYPATAAASGVVIDDDFMRRLGVVGTCIPDNAEGAWVIENVATRAAFRRRGLVAALIDATLERGRSKGYSLGQISVFIGNEPARSAYLKAGFEVKDAKRDPTFEAELKFPGIERMLRAL